MRETNPLWAERLANDTIQELSTTGNCRLKANGCKRLIYTYRISLFRHFELGSKFTLRITNRRFVMKSEYNGVVYDPKPNSVFFMKDDAAVACLESDALHSAIKEMTKLWKQVYVNAQVIKWYDEDAHWPEIRVAVPGDGDLQALSYILRYFHRWPVSSNEIYGVHISESFTSYSKNRILRNRPDLEPYIH